MIGDSMTFTIDQYTVEHLPGAVAVYNAETAAEAHIAPLSPDLFQELVVTKSYFDPAGVFVAIRAGTVIGWVHACVAPGSEGHHHPARSIPHIRMLVFDRDRPKVGQALVSEATQWLEQSVSKHANTDAILALHARAGYPFYRGIWMGGEPLGPVTMPHVQMALQVGGYRNSQESIFMVAEMEALLPAYRASLAVEIHEESMPMAHEAMRESWIGFEPMRTCAMVGESEVGSIGWVILPHVGRRLGAPCVNIWSLGVQEQHRRKGIASALVSHIMRRGYESGARFASLATQLWNAPAHATYTKMSFVPYCIVVGRERPLGGVGSQC